MCLLIALSAHAQQGSRHVASLLQRARSGHGAEVIAEVDALLSKDPRNPGLLFVRGIAEPDAAKALTYFRKVVQVAPKSEWADDALYRQYQYSLALGASANAARTLERLQKEYPASPLIAHPDEPAAPQDADCTAYTLQVGTRLSQAKASAMRDEMRAEGYSAELRSTSGGKKKTCDVVVGSFPTKESARTFARKLKARHDVDAVVVCR